MNHILAIRRAKSERERAERAVKILEQDRRRLTLAVQNANAAITETNAMYMAALKERARATLAVEEARQAAWDAQRKRMQQLPAAAERYGNVFVVAIALVVLALIYWGFVQ